MLPINRFLLHLGEGIDLPQTSTVWSTQNSYRPQVWPSRHYRYCRLQYTIAVNGMLANQRTLGKKIKSLSLLTRLYLRNSRAPLPAKDRKISGLRERHPRDRVRMPNLTDLHFLVHCRTIFSHRFQSRLVFLPDPCKLWQPLFCSLLLMSRSLIIWRRDTGMMLSCGTSSQRRLLITYITFTYNIHNI